MLAVCSLDGVFDGLQFETELIQLNFYLGFKSEMPTYLIYVLVYLLLLYLVYLIAIYAARFAFPKI